jgi:DNA-binding NarL/FixJ family response regulator
VLARRWCLPSRLATLIERHHSDEAMGDAAIVRLADMLVTTWTTIRPTPARLLKMARSVGLGSSSLRATLFELPLRHAPERRQVDPCPLSARELKILERLGQDKVYKQIAAELSLFTSTVRTHVHNTYAKLGVVDRAQAVLVATQRGWL